MRFDTTLFYHVGEPYDWGLLFDEMHETVVLVDALGYTGVWLAEHHFAWDGWYRSASNPMLLGADVVRTSPRLRVGQCGVVLPDWHPLRVAEDIAFLDQMSKGRVDFGIAPGINSRACAHFHPAGDRRDPARNRALFDECLDVILKAFEDRPFSHRGEHFRFPVPGWKEANPLAHDPAYHAEDGELERLGVFPKPWQKPHPPIYQMAESRESHAACARRGIATMSQYLSAGRMRENWDHYREVARAEERPARNPGVEPAIMRVAFLADSVREAERAARPGINLLGAWGSANPYRRRTSMVTPEEWDEGDVDLDWFDFHMKHDTILVGTPDTVAVQVGRLRGELGCRHLALFLNIPRLSFGQVKRSLRLFAEEVMPRFAEPDAACRSNPLPEPLEQNA